MDVSYSAHLTACKVAYAAANGRAEQLWAGRTEQPLHRATCTGSSWRAGERLDCGAWGPVAGFRSVSSSCADASHAVQSLPVSRVGCLPLTESHALVSGELLPQVPTMGGDSHGRCDILHTYS